MPSQQLVTRVASSTLPTEFGTFVLHAFDEANVIPTTHLALVLGKIDDGPSVLTRIHSECLTGDVFGSMRCDCQAQLLKALESISQEGRGVLVYLRQEGRGSGLASKISAYALQDQGMDTVEADQHLGLPVDERDYGVAREIMGDLGVSKIKLLTNNPQKVAGLQSSELKVVEQISLVVPPTKYNARYLEAKRIKLGHLLRPPKERS